MNLRHCLLSMIVLALAASLGRAEERLPNIVFILADDLGYRELGSYGQTKIRTPHLDRLARQGVSLTQHYSGNAVCAPSRCVLMTGMHPGHAFVRTNKATPPEGQQPIPSSVVTLPERLRAEGYVTGAFGKWGLGGPDSPGEPLRQGVDRFFGYNCQSHAHSYYPSYLWDNNKRIPLNNQPAVPGHGGLEAGADPSDPRSYDAYKGKDYAPDRINEQVLAFIRENQARPFFLYYPSVIPHLALHVPDEELKQYQKLGWKDPPFTRPRGGYTPHHSPRAAYAAMISRLDRYVGNVLRLLDELGLTENTIVVFSSDNGTTHLGDEVDYEFFNSVGELRGLKGSLYEGGVRVPTIVRWPKRIAPNSKSDFVSGFEDWMPTFLDMIGRTDAELETDGISIAPALHGEPQVERRFLYREFPSYGGQQSIRAGKWKAIRQNMSKGNLAIELYDIGSDPGEKTNVAGRFPHVVEQLADMMRREHTPSKLFPLPGIDPMPQKRRKR